MEAVNIPLTVKCDYFDAENEQKNSARRVAPYVSCSASKMANGTVNINLANADLKNATKVTVNLDGINGKVQNAQILTSKNIADHNTFENPNLVKPTSFNGAKIANGQLVVDMPKASIVCLQIK
jgi:alpha-N-arabinofuranosidase